MVRIDVNRIVDVLEGAGFSHLVDSGSYYFSRAHGDNLAEDIAITSFGSPPNAMVMGSGVSVLFTPLLGHRGLHIGGSLLELYPNYRPDDPFLSRDPGKIEFPTSEAQSKWIVRFGETAPGMVSALVESEGPALLERTEAAREAALTTFNRALACQSGNTVQADLAASLSTDQRRAVDEVLARPLVLFTAHHRTETRQAVIALVLDGDPDFAGVELLPKPLRWGPFDTKEQELPEQAYWRLRLLTDLIIRHRARQ